MLEIIALIILTKKVGAMVGQKDYPADWFKTMAAGLWFGGEFIGAVIGTLATIKTGSPLLITYIVALVGALLGAVLAIVMANYPPAAYRWWRVVACLLIIIVFLVAALVNPNLDMAPRITALSFFFISIMLGTMLYQDYIDQFRARVALLAIAIVCWVILALGYAIAGLDFVNDNPWVSVMGLIAIAVTAITMVWSVIDSFRNARPLRSLK